MMRGRVLSFLDAHKRLAKVDTSGISRTINTALIAPGGLEPGDWVLIRGGSAVRRIDEAAARHVLDLLAQIRGGEPG